MSIVYFTDDRLILEVKHTDTVGSIKEKVQDELGLPKEDQRILFSGKQLQDEVTLAMYNIQRESTVHVISSRRKSPSHSRPKQGKVSMVKAYLQYVCFILMSDG